MTHLFSDHLCEFIFPGLFGFLRGFCRIRDGFSTFYPLHLFPRDQSSNQSNQTNQTNQGQSEESNYSDLIEKLGEIPSSNIEIGSFSVPELLFEKLLEIAEFSREEIDRKSSISDYLSKPEVKTGSVYSNFGDYGSIYVFTLYGSLYSIDNKKFKV